MLAVKNAIKTMKENAEQVSKMMKIKQMWTILKYRQKAAGFSPSSRASLRSTTANFHLDEGTK